MQFATSSSMAVAAPTFTSATTTANTEFWDESKQPQAIAAMAVSLILLLVSMGARVWAQKSIRHLWEWDNVLIAISGVLCFATILACLVGLRFGLGLHLLRVVAEDPHAPHNVERVSFIGYLLPLLQSPSLTLIKLSILFFYRRIFTSSAAQQRIFTLALHILGTYTLLLGIGSFVEFVVQCNPIRYYWAASPEILTLAGKSAANAVNGWCIPIKPGYGIPLILGLVSDVAILLLPAIGLWNLQLRLAQKIGVFASLSLGIFACLIEIVRIVFVMGVTQTQDLTWTNLDAVVWSAVETSVAIACANIPACAPLLKRARAARRSAEGAQGNPESGGWHTWFSRRFGESSLSYISSVRSSIRARMRRSEKGSAQLRGSEGSSEDYDMLERGHAVVHVYAPKQEVRRPMIAR